MKLKPYHGLAVSLILFVGVTLVSYQSTQRFLKGDQDIAETRARLDGFSGLVINLLEAESAERGYLLSGDERLLEAYRVAQAELLIQQHEIRYKLHDPSDQALVEKIDGLVQRKIARLQQGLDARLRGLRLESDVAKSLVESGTTQEIQQIAVELRKHERARMDERTLDADRNAQHNWGSAVMLLVFAAILVAIATASIIRDSNKREAAEQASVIAQEKTALWARELERVNSETRFVNDISDALAIAFSSNEVYETVAEYLQRFLPGAQGTFAILNNSHNLLETAWTWNPQTEHNRVFSPVDCRALRRGGAYSRKVDSPNLSCTHVAEGKTKNYLCLPLVAQGETIGVLHLDFGPAKWEERQRKLIAKLAETVAMKLAHLRLQEKLKVQAIRDPLTGIFNRRYMEESLQRELSRAERRCSSVGVIMIDLDHFKRYNDSFGHEAGDRVLQEVAAVLRDSYRREDIVCRYGGEELLVIVPEMKREEVIERADLVRERIRQIRIQHRNQLLPGITASFGVAVYPDDAKTQSDLLNKADMALYNAKHAGRDRVMASYEPVEIDAAAKAANVT
jgi:diguanylate cyclase (GGDEF)-like protein